MSNKTSDKLKVIILNASEHGEGNSIKYQGYGWSFSYTTQTHKLAHKVKDYLPDNTEGEIICLNKVLDLSTSEKEEASAKRLIERLETADAIVVVAPSHFGSTSHLFDLIASKSFYLARKDYEGFKLQNRVGGAVTIGKRMHGGAVFTLEDIIHCWVRHQMFITPGFPGVQLGIPAWSNGFNFQDKWLQADEDSDTLEALKFYTLNLVNFTRIVKTGFQLISSRNYRIAYNPFEGTKCTVERRGTLECRLSEESIVEKGLGSNWKGKLTFKNNEKVNLIAIHAALGKFKETSSLVARYLASAAEIGADCKILDISKGFASCKIYKVKLHDGEGNFDERIEVLYEGEKLSGINQVIDYLNKNADGIVGSSDGCNSNNPHNNLEALFCNVRRKQRAGSKILAGKPFASCSFSMYRADPERINFNMWLDASECMMSIYSSTSGSQYGIMSLSIEKNGKLHVIDDFAKATTRIHGPLFARAALAIKLGQEKCGRFRPEFDPQLYTRQY